MNFISTAGRSTPFVAASGATTQWANGPTAPPTSQPILNRLRRDAMLTIGKVDMILMNVGMLSE